MAIVDGVAEHIGQSLAWLEGVDRRIGVIQCVGIGAVGVDDHRTVGTDHRAANPPGADCDHARFRAGFDALHHDGLGGIGVAVLGAAVVVAVGGAWRHIPQYGGRHNRIDRFGDGVGIWCSDDLAVDANGDAAGGRQLAASALVLAAACRSCPARVGVLVVNQVVDLDAVAGGGVGVFVGQTLQHGIHKGSGCCAVERNLQRATRVAPCADCGGANTHVCAIEVDACVAAARGTKHVVDISAAIPLQGQHSALPFATGAEQIELRV